MEDIPPHKLDEFKEGFDIVDKDRDGLITIKELTMVLRSLNSDFTQNQVDSIISEVDTNFSGKLNLEDFLNLMGSNYRETDSDEEIINAFKVFDKEGNGVISAYDLKHIMTTLGDKLTDEEVGEMIREADINGDGYIFYEDFVRTMMSK